MTTLKAAIISLATVAIICMCGIGIYAADASTDHAVQYGYGVIARQ